MEVLEVMEVFWICARAKEHFQILMNGWSASCHQYDSNGLYVERESGSSGYSEEEQK